MSEQRGRWLKAGPVLLSIAIFTSTAAVVPVEAGEEGPYPRILVTGEGRVEVAPDMAVLVLMVTREADTARAALDANSAAMREVLAAMQAEGIEERDLRTANFAIEPRYSYPPKKSNGEPEAPRIVGYTVRNSLTVRVREVGRVGAILDRSVSLGVNEGGSITFTNDDPSGALSEARTRAMAEALAKARTLATAAGVKIGKVLEISEQSFAPRPVSMAGAEMAMSRAAAPVPVAAGENSYAVTVRVSFAIDQ
jgi:uncharacterized protein YggE